MWTQLNFGYRANDALQVASYQPRTWLEYLKSRKMCAFVFPVVFLIELNWIFVAPAGRSER